jgi:signal transduction histidine kinase/CHASE1-domain containing sensor protein/ActR/RegA family two-component response regulator
VAVTTACLATALVTVGAWVQSERLSEDDHAQRARDLASAIETRLGRLELSLHSGRAFIESSEEVSPDEWQHFVETSIGDTSADGSGLAWIVAVPRSELAAFEAEQRATWWPEFRVHAHPEASAPLGGDACVIRYHAPLGANAAALGFDSASVPQSRAALQRAARTGDVALAESFPLVQFPGDPPGTALYMSVHVTERTDAARDERVRGWVAAPIRAGALLENGDGLQSDVAVRLVDGENVVSAGTSFAPAQRLLSTTDRIAFGGRHLLFELLAPAPPRYVHALAALRAFGTSAALGGSFVLFVVLLARSGRRAEKLADDATRELANERALQAQAACLGSIGAWELDLATRTVKWSDEVCRIHDLPKGHVPTLEGALSFYPPDVRPVIRGCVERAIETHEPWDVELPLVTAKGRHVWTRSMGRADVVDGRVVRVFGSFQDVTVRRLADEAREEMLAALRASTELAERRAEELERARAAAESSSRAKSEFLANMSHEIRTPLGAVLGYAQLIASGDVEDCERSAAAEIVARNGTQLVAILDDVLDISKIEAGELVVESQPVDPRALVDDVVALFASKAVERGLALTVAHDEDLPRHVATDQVRLRQVVANLVGNAVKFTERGSVRVHTHGRSVGDGLVELAVAVEDTGIGIPSEQHERIFDLFTQADGSTTRRFGGTGLGLAICRRLTRHMGGDVTVASQPGRGSTFTATITCAPCAPSPRLDEVEPALPSSEAPRASELADCAVLLVDDGPDNRRLLSKLLTRAGAHVETAENGLVALERFERRRAEGQGFDIVLMDMQMPELDGYGAARELRRRGENVPIVAVTAHAMPGDREACLAAGCDDYLTKPVDRRALVAVCRRVLAR